MKNKRKHGIKLSLKILLEIATGQFFISKKITKCIYHT